MRINYHNIIFAALFFAVSCSKEDLRTESSLRTDARVRVDTNSISLEKAEVFAKDLFKSQKNPAAKSSIEKSIESIAPVGSDKNKPSYFIINYKGGGFLILSGDKRIYPVLAYSETEHFDLDAESYPDLLVGWLRMQDDMAGLVRRDSITDRSQMGKMWTTGEVENFIFSKRPKADSKTSKAAASCESQPFTTPILIASYGPLLPTTWGQGVGYNNQTQYLACTNYSNGYAPTGCVATAMSQVLRYYQYPNSYDWSIMPTIITDSNSATAGANEVARLMRACGNSVGMDYGCDGSSSETEDVPGALKSAFGFSSADYAGFNITTTYNELVNGNPVILRGGEKGKKWLIFNVYQNGHAWVCDGMEYYRMKIRVMAGQHGYETTCVPKYTYHMNWGWNGAYNGWYSTFENPEGSFSYQSAMVFNIRK